MKPADARSAAHLLWELWRGGRTIDALPGSLRPETVDDGWQIQRELDAVAGPPVGWKIAGTSRAGRRHIGAMSPLLGRLYAPFVLASGSAVSYAPLTMRSVEAEFAFLIGADLHLDLDRATDDDVMSAVASLHPAIEIPDTRFTDFARVGLPSLLADALCGGHLMVGPPAVDWRADQLPYQAVVLAGTAGRLSEGTGRNVLGDPCTALAWAARELAARGSPLRAGDIVTTGAATPPVPVPPDDTLVAEFGRLGTVSAVVR